MENQFFKYWFSGFEKGLMQADPNSRMSILKECAKACSESYTKQIYQEEYSKSEDLNDFLKRLNNRFSEMRIDVIQENQAFLFTYTYCACDLVKEGYISCGQLCECSRFSLQENWESVLGKGRVQVQLLESILRGGDCCKLLVEVDAI